MKITSTALVALTLASVATITVGAPVGASTTMPVPERILDTRHGTGAPAGRVVPGTTLRLTGASTTGVGTVALNLTASDATDPGYATAWPCDEDRPDT